MPCWTNNDLDVFITIPELFAIVFWHLKLRQINSISEETSNAAKPSTELTAFLRFVADKLQRTSKFLVVICQPFQHGELLLYLKNIAIFVLEM